jgi:hypothetical protein
MKVIGRVVMRGRGKIVAMGVQTPRAVVDANAEEFLKTLEAAITARPDPRLIPLIRVL